MTAAETLRRAAAALRETANAASQGEPWTAFDNDGRSHVYGDDGWIVFGPAGSPEMQDSEQGMADATYIALLHPPVALAVAAWLDMTARWVNGAPTSENAEHALAVARAVLREES